MRPDEQLLGELLERYPSSRIIDRRSDGVGGFEVLPDPLPPRAILAFADGTEIDLGLAPMEVDVKTVDLFSGEARPPIAQVGETIELNGCGVAEGRWRVVGTAPDGTLSLERLP